MSGAQTRDFGTPLREYFEHISPMHRSIAHTGERTGHFTSTVNEDRLRRLFLLHRPNRPAGPPLGDVVLVSWPMALHQPGGSPENHRRKLDASPRLIAADAALTLVEHWRTELAVLRRRSPTSDAVRTLADCVDELSAAITAGHELTIQLTIAEAHHLSHIPVSTLRWLCNHKSSVVGAHKHEGIWYLDRVLFERYLASPDGQVAASPDAAHSIFAPTKPVLSLAREPHAD